MWKPRLTQIQIRNRGLFPPDQRIRWWLRSSPGRRNEYHVMELLVSDATMGELRWLVKTYRPYLLFLSETTMRNEKTRRLMWSLGYTSSFAVSCDGCSGGLVLIWTAAYDVSMRGYNPHCIDVVVLVEGSDPWRVTFVYEPRSVFRHVF